MTTCDDDVIVAAGSTVLFTDVSAQLEDFEICPEEGENKPTSSLSTDNLSPNIKDETTVSGHSPIPVCMVTNIVKIESNEDLI